MDCQRDLLTTPRLVRTTTVERSVPAEIVGPTFWPKGGATTEANEADPPWLEHTYELNTACSGLCPIVFTGRRCGLPRGRQTNAVAGSVTNNHSAPARIAARATHLRCRTGRAPAVTMTTGLGSCSAPHRTRDLATSDGRVRGASGCAANTGPAAQRTIACTTSLPPLAVRCCAVHEAARPRGDVCRQWPCCRRARGCRIH